MCRHQKACTASWTRSAGILELLPHTPWVLYRGNRAQIGKRGAKLISASGADSNLNPRLHPRLPPLA